MRAVYYNNQIHINYNEKANLEKKYNSLVPEPHFSFNYDGSLFKYSEMCRWDRLRTEPQKFMSIRDKYLEAKKEYDLYIENNKNISQLEKISKDIVEWSLQKEEWRKSRDKFIYMSHESKVVADDNNHVSETGLCCGHGKDRKYSSSRVPRSCKRKAKQGNFCTQHAKVVEEYRLGE